MKHYSFVWFFSGADVRVRRGDNDEIKVTTLEVSIGLCAIHIAILYTMIMLLVLIVT